MLRRTLLALLVVASLTTLVQTADAAGPPRRGRILNYLFGGYGPGPFGTGYFSYAGHPPIRNYTEHGRRLP